VAVIGDLSAGLSHRWHGNDVEELLSAWILDHGLKKKKKKSIYSMEKSSSLSNALTAKRKQKKYNEMKKNECVILSTRTETLFVSAVLY